MDKFSELKAAAMAATPGPWVVTEKNNVEAPNQKRFRPVAYIFGNRAEHKRAADAAFIAAANPAVVLALLAELEAKDERIGELEAIATNYAGKFQKAQDALKYAAIMSDEDKKKISELEAKLATPVRLPEKFNMKMAGDKATKSMFYGHNSAINDSAKAVRTAGFTVQGDE